MEDKKRNICYGIEIETESDYSMPERVMVYDICEYEYQIRAIRKGHIEQKDYQNYREKKSRMKRGDILLPTVTVVLYLGEGRWEGRLSLSQMFGMPEDYRTDLKEFFSGNAV